MKPVGQGFEQFTRTDCDVALTEFDGVEDKESELFPAVGGVDNDSLLFTEVGAIDVEETTGANEGSSVRALGLALGMPVASGLIDGDGV
jgi:hypothetical protein